MRDWKKLTTRVTASIREAIAKLDVATAKIVMVLEEGGRLVGTITDGDVRRGLLRGCTLDDAVSTVMNKKPITAGFGEEREALGLLMRSKQVSQIPLVDRSGRVMGLETVDDLTRTERQETPIVLMAGGEGRRLLPLTAKVPKPLLPVGEKPLLETILETFVSHGFHRFFLSVNYRAEMIMNYFGDGAEWGANISYLRERRPLGTAGPLALLPDLPAIPFIVMNADLLTNCNFVQLLEFHKEQGAKATMAVRHHHVRVPYGVARLRGQWVEMLEEKPTLNLFVNAGLYVLDPTVLDLVPKDEALDMPDSLNPLALEGNTVSAFPVREYWLDIGHRDDYEQAKGDFSTVFE